MQTFLVRLSHFPIHCVSNQKFLKQDRRHFGPKVRCLEKSKNFVQNIGWKLSKIDKWFLKYRIFFNMITYLSNIIFFNKFFRKWSVKNKLHFMNWGNISWRCFIIFFKHACSIILYQKAVFESLFIDSISNYVVILYNVLH